MTRKRATFSQEMTYQLFDKHRGLIEVDGLLFAPDPIQYRTAERLIFSDAQYIEWAQKQKQIEKKLSAAKTRYDNIIEESHPNSMQELRKTRNAIPQLKVHLDTNISFLESECKKIKSEIKTENDILKTLSKNTPEYSLQEEKVNKKKRELNRTRRNCHQRISNCKKRIIYITDKLSSLECEKQKLMEQQNIEIQQLRRELCNIGQNKAKRVRELAGNLISVPGKVINLIKSDPDISAETMDQLLILMNGHISPADLWEVDSPDPRDGTRPLISLCIEDDLDQTMADLIVRVALVRNCQFIDAAPILLKMREENRLVYFKHYNDGTESIMQWSPKPAEPNRHKNYFNNNCVYPSEDI